MPAGAPASVRLVFVVAPLTCPFGDNASGLPGCPDDLKHILAVLVFRAMQELIACHEPLRPLLRHESDFIGPSQRRELEAGANRVMSLDDFGLPRRLSVGTC